MLFVDKEVFCIVRNGSVVAALALEASSTSSSSSASLFNSVANSLNSSSAAATLQSSLNATVAVSEATCSTCTINQQTSSAIGELRFSLLSR